MTISKPIIFDYLDIVQFLNAYFKWRKSTDHLFTYSSWSNELNIGSKTILRFILQRKRRITEKSRLAIKSNLKLNEEEAEYYDQLVSYSQPKSEPERLAAGRQLITLQRKQYKQVEILPEEAAADVLGPVILTLLTFHDFKATAQSVADTLNADLNKVQSILDRFVEVKILELKAGQYYLDAEAIKIADKPNLKALENFHRYWLDKGKDAFSFDFKVRRFRSLKFALTEHEFDLAIEKINEFAVSILGQFHTSQMKGRRLYMLEKALFPITHPQSSVDQNT